MRIPERRSRSLRVLASTLLVLAALGLSGCAGPQAPRPAPGTLRIYLARHGETDWNAAHRLQGWTDIPLNAKGVAQAERLRDELEGIALDHVYSSTLARSRATAEMAHGSAPIESLDELRERNLGAFQGRVIDGSDPAVAEAWTRRRADPEDALDGGESRTSHLARVKIALDRIRARHASGSILIVGHGFTNPLVLRALLGLDDAAAMSISQANDEIYLIELAPGRPARTWKRITNEHVSEL